MHRGVYCVTDRQQKRHQFQSCCFCPTPGQGEVTNGIVSRSRLTAAPRPNRPRPAWTLDDPLSAQNGGRCRCRCLSPVVQNCWIRDLACCCRCCQLRKHQTHRPPNSTSCRTRNASTPPLLLLLLHTTSTSSSSFPPPTPPRPGEGEGGSHLPPYCLPAVGWSMFSRRPSVASKQTEEMI